MAEPRKRPGDVTGRASEILAEKAKQDGIIRDKEMTLLTIQSEQAKSEVIDLVQHEAVVDAEVVLVDAPPVKIRLNSTLEHVTIGAGTDYNFDEGQSYIVPKNVADHLEEKGYVWH
jgi:hypothetical protein